MPYNPTFLYHVKQTSILCIPFDITKQWINWNSIKGHEVFCTIETSFYFFCYFLQICILDQWKNWHLIQLLTKWKVHFQPKGMKHLVRNPGKSSTSRSKKKQLWTLLFHPKRARKSDIKVSRENCPESKRPNLYMDTLQTKGVKVMYYKHGDDCE